MDGLEKVTAGPFPLEFVRLRFVNDTAVVEVDMVGWKVVWPTPLTVFTDPLDIFFLAKLLSESDEGGGGRPGSGLGTTIGGKALIDCGPYTRAAGEGEGSITTSSAGDRGESLASLGLRNLLEDDPAERLENCEAVVV